MINHFFKMYSNSIIQLRLKVKNLKKIDFDESYTIRYIDKSNYKENIESLIKVSTLMKQDFDWEGTPNEEDIHKRFKSNSKCLVSYYDGKIVGWIWGNDNFTPKWVDIIQELNENEIYIGGSYLSKKVNRPKESGQVFYNIWFDYFLTNFNKQYAYSYVDFWNTHSLNLAYNIGMVEYNFIK